MAMESGNPSTHESTREEGFPAIEDVLGLGDQPEDDFVAWEKLLEDIPTPLREEGQEHPRSPMGLHDRGRGGDLPNPTIGTFPHGHPSYHPTKLQRTESFPGSQMVHRNLSERQLSYPMSGNHVQDGRAVCHAERDGMVHGGPAFAAAQAKLQETHRQGSDSGSQLGIAQKVAISLQRQDSIGQGSYLSVDSQQSQGQGCCKSYPMKPGPAGRPDPVSMPSVEALFRDISSKSPEKRWDRRSLTGAGKPPTVKKENHQNAQPMHAQFHDSERILEAAIASIRTRLGRNGSEASKRAAAGLGPQKPNNYLGVSRMRWTAHWDASIKKPDGELVALGSFNSEEAAARAHDIAALKLFGRDARTNFVYQEYHDGFKDLEDVPVQDVIGAIQEEAASDIQKHSRFRGVFKAQNGRWEARWMESPRRSEPRSTESGDGLATKEGLQPPTPQLASRSSDCAVIAHPSVKTEPVAT